MMWSKSSLELETRSASVRGYHCSERMLSRCTSSGTRTYWASGGSRLKASTARGNSRKMAAVVCAVCGMRWRRWSSVGKPGYMGITVVCNTDMAMTFTQPSGRTGSLQYRLRYQLSNCTTTCFPALISRWHLFWHVPGAPKAVTGPRQDLHVTIVFASPWMHLSLSQNPFPLAERSCDIVASSCTPGVETLHTTLATVFAHELWSTLPYCVWFAG